MNDGRIATRYAKALFLLTEQEGSSAQVYEESLQLLPTIHYAGAAFAKVLGFALASLSDRKAVLEEVVKPVSLWLYKLAAFMLEQGRGGYVPRAIEVYAELYRQRAGIVYVELISASELTGEQKRTIESYLSRAGIKSVPAYRTNKELLGGFQLIVDGRRLDKSLLGELVRLRSLSGC